MFSKINKKAQLPILPLPSLLDFYVMNYVFVLIFNQYLIHNQISYYKKSLYPTQVNPEKDCVFVCRNEYICMALHCLFFSPPY